MKRNTRMLTLPGLALSAVLALAACGSDEDAATPTSQESTAADAAAQSEAATHNDADVTFASEMIPHHNQAIEMADMALAADDTTLTELAGQIKAAQAPEIETMSQWLTGWGEEVPDGSAMGSMDMGGMMSQEDMDSLMQLQGGGFDAMWLQMMIEHHQGAIEMAQSEGAQGEYPDAMALAEQIITAQQAEIEQMQEMSDSLTG